MGRAEVDGDPEALLDLPRPRELLAPVECERLRRHVRQRALDSVNDERGDTVVSSEATKYTEKITCTLISTNKDSMTLQYGRQNVTDANGVLKVDHNWSNAGDHWSVVLLLLAKNNRPWTKVIKDCNVTSLGEFKLDKDDAAGREVELTYQNDETGSGCVGYIKSNDTTASSTPGK